MFKWRISEKEFVSIPFLSWIEIDGYGKLRYRDTLVPIPTKGRTVKLMGREFDVPTLVCITHKNIYVDLSKHEQVKPMFIDGDTSNWDVDNLSYKFEPALTYRKYPGYRVIPGHTRYAMNENGNVIRINDGKHFSITVKEGNYAKVSLKHDCKPKVTTRLVHRCMALTWLEYPANADTLDVNHLNAIKSDYAKSNLEWATRKRNNDHAVDHGLWSLSVPVILYDTASDTKTRFPSIARASLMTGITDTTVGKHLGTNKVFANRWVVKAEDDPTPWPDLNSAEGYHLGAGIKTPVRITYPDGRTEVVASANEASRVTGIKSPTVSWRMNNAPGRRMRSGYGFDHVNRILADESVARRKQQESKVNPIASAVLAIKDGIVTRYESIAAAENQTGIPYHGLKHRVRDGVGSVDENGFTYRYEDDAQHQVFWEKLLKNPRAVVVDKPNGDSQIVLGLNSAVHLSGLSLSAVSWRCHNPCGKGRNADGWNFRYLNR